MTNPFSDQPNPYQSPQAPIQAELTQPRSKTFRRTGCLAIFLFSDLAIFGYLAWLRSTISLPVLDILLLATGFVALIVIAIFAIRFLI